MLNDRIFVAGHKGMVGSAIVRQLQKLGCKNIITCNHAELDLTQQLAVRDFFCSEKIDSVILAAAKVGGIHANDTYPADFIYINLMIQTNVIYEAHRAKVQNLLFLGSSCVYPKFAPQPIKEDDLLTGSLEPTNEFYSVAKIAGIKMCAAYNRQYGIHYRSVMPTNLYGPDDNYDLKNSHVVPAMIRKYHLAKLAMDGDLEAIVADEKRYGIIPADIRQAIGYSAVTGTLAPTTVPKVILWGSGLPRREFLYVDDMAAACIHIMQLDDTHCTDGNSSVINIGSGEDRTIRQTAKIIAELVGFTGETVYNGDMPDGTPRKLLDLGRINELGWKPQLSFSEGLQKVYALYKKNVPYG